MEVAAANPAVLSCAWWQGSVLLPFMHFDHTNINFGFMGNKKQVVHLAQEKEDWSLLVISDQLRCTVASAAKFCVFWGEKVVSCCSSSGSRWCRKWAGYVGRQESHPCTPQVIYCEKNLSLKANSDCLIQNLLFLDCAVFCSSLLLFYQINLQHVVSYFVFLILLGGQKAVESIVLTITVFASLLVLLAFIVTQK